MPAENQASRYLCNECNAIFTPHSYEGFQQPRQNGVLNGIVDSVHEDDDDPSSPHFYPGIHHPSYKSWNHAVEAGCWICSRLSPESKLLSGGGDDDDIAEEGNFFQPIRFRLEAIEGRPRYKLHFSNHFYESTGHIAVEKSEASLELQSAAEASKSSTWTGSEGVARLAGAWLRQCRETHLSCRVDVHDGWLPTRLLRVSDETIQLTETAVSNEPYGPYATLSHCWGTVPFFVLTPETMPQLKAGLPVSAFPTSFEHAMITTRRLGIGFLWIDSYCIIQGNSDDARADWDREASRMSDVYSNGIVNIGAAHAVGPSGGLFSERDIGKFNSVMVRWRPRSIEEEGLYNLRLPSNEPLEDSFTELNSSTMMSRAWVVQECVLSPRMLSFAKQQLYWQCTEVAASEDFFSEEAVFLEWAREFPFWSLSETDNFLRANRTVRVAGTRDRAGMFERWFGLMERYSKAAFTYPEKDIFRALEGVGKRIARMTGTMFQHGILGTTFPAILLWQATGLACRRAPASRAPSWHWASRDGGLSFDVPQSLLRSTRQRGAMLASLAFCFPTDAEPSIDSGPRMMCIGRTVRVSPDGHDSLQRWQEEKTSFLVTRHRKARVFVDVDRDMMERGLRSPLMILPLQSLLRDRDISSRAYIRMVQVQGLLLCPTRVGSYERVGTFQAPASLLEELSSTKPQIVVLE